MKSIPFYETGCFSFASGGLLFSSARKVAKRAGRNLRFLHFRARYTLCEYIGFYHTFTQFFLFRFVIESSLLQRRYR